MSAILDSLYDALQMRPRPEDVAELVLEVAGSELSDNERSALNVVARGSLKRGAHKYSSMASDFVRPVSAEKQSKTASALFGASSLSAADCLVPAKIEELVRSISPVIHKTFGDSKKLNKAARHALGLFKVQRWYNKRFRFLVRLEDKITRLAFANRKYEFTRVGKSALATKITREDFDKDLLSACLVTYLASRMSRRSVFTNKAQDRAFDGVSEALLDACELRAGTNWYVIAHVLPDQRVLKHLYEEERGRLLGVWWELMADMAEMLRGVWRTSHFDQRDMIVERGNDSSTWNQVAGGWNKAREHWVSLLHAVGQESLLDYLCPGKVMRLMAADVAAWHRQSGKSVHPDTKVWALLPWPWDVVSGEATCTKQMIVNMCRAHGVDENSWVKPRTSREAVAFQPTPELVHGVEVSSPNLAAALRKAGVFSGKGISGDVPPFRVVRDEGGFALNAAEEES